MSINTSITSGIRDNYQRGSAGDFLKQKINSELRIVSAYFTIYAYEALKSELDTISNLKFLFGEPRFVRSLDPDRTEKKSFVVEEDGLKLQNQLHQKQIARDCATWIRNKKDDVPNRLFFADEHTIDLNKIYDTKNKRYKVRGLFRIFESYKFTIDENTPIEEEVALDPELLGRVFENLLAAYNPETGITARKQTGSFYTPREIVNYMVDESLMAHFETRLQNAGFKRENLTEHLRHLLSYNQDPHKFSEAEIKCLIESIDTLKIFDPACGSGAFPMGILHKLVFILSKLDLQNRRWKDRQIERVEQIPDSVIREQALEDIEQAFERNELDYGRKLYLIENCLYGIDIQPIAVQIAKLRCFIALVVHQIIDDSRPNRGIRPLPNLETKFVAANTLLGIEKPQQMMLRNPIIDQKEKELADVRHRYFTARTPSTKEKYRQQDAQLREELAQLLQKDGFGRKTTEQLAHWNPYDQNVSADFFDREWMFGLLEGFDIAIGNPPYVRQEQIKDLKPFLKSLNTRFWIVLIGNIHKFP